DQLVSRRPMPSRSPRCSTTRPLMLSPIRTPPPPTSTLFPYTTLFRSLRNDTGDRRADVGVRKRILGNAQGGANLGGPGPGRLHRSEEHTSELQSHLNLVCRLLLEKKKIHDTYKRHAVVSLHTYVVSRC